MSRSGDAYEVALEWLKQIIALASGIIVFSGTLAPLVSKVIGWPYYILGVSWLLFVASIVFSLEVISAITYSRLNDNTGWSEGKAKNEALIAKWCFIVGIVVFVLFAAVSAWSMAAASASIQLTPMPSPIPPAA